jgi:hypothetical protein
VDSGNGAVKKNLDKIQFVASDMLEVLSKILCFALNMEHMTCRADNLKCVVLLEARWLFVRFLVSKVSNFLIRQSIDHFSSKIFKRP